MWSVDQVASWMSRGSTSIPYLLLQHYKHLSLSDAEMMLVIHLQAFAAEGISFPSIEQLGERMSCSTEELIKMLNRLRKEEFLDIRSSYDQEGKVSEYYSLEPLWKKLLTVCEQSVEETAVANEGTSAWPNDSGDWQQLEGEVFRRFEQEFGRPLSPIECETISMWFDNDHLEPSIILLALREAVISNKLSLRYIDRILFEWQKNGIKTPEQVRTYTKKFRQPLVKHPGAEETSKQEVEFSFYNWLEK